MEKELSMDDLFKIAEDAKVTKDCFSKEIFYFAWLYRCVFWNLAYAFCNKSEEFKICETEYASDHRRGENELSFEMCLKKRKMSELFLFIKEREKMIPPELRKMFLLSAGCVYGDEYSLVIRADDIVLISNEEWLFMGAETDLYDEIRNGNVDSGTKKIKRILTEKFS